MINGVILRSLTGTHSNTCDLYTGGTQFESPSEFQV